MKNSDAKKSGGLLHQALSTSSGLGLVGIDLKMLLDRSLIAPGAIEISTRQQVLLKLNSIDMTGDEGHGLGQRRLSLGFASIGLRAMLSTPTLNDALNILSRYFQTTSSPFALKITSSAGTTQVAFRVEGQDSSRAVLLESIWSGAIYGFLSWFVGRRIPVTAVPVMRVDDPYACKMPWAAEAPNVASDISAFQMASSCLNWKRKAGDVEEPLWEALRFWIDGKLLDAGSGATSLSTNIGEPAGLRATDLPRFESVGQRQRSRLWHQRYGASFREVRGEVILTQASDLLRTSTKPIDEIARLLGYAEERSFRRFITRHTGQTPSQIRRQQRAEESLNHAEIDERIHALTRKLDF